MKRAGLVLEGGANRGVFYQRSTGLSDGTDFYIPYVVGTPQVRAMQWIMCQGSHCAKRTVTLLRIRRSVSVTIKNTLKTGTLLIWI